MAASEARQAARTPVAVGRRMPPGAPALWIYARHELLYICWALMDVALIAPAALILMTWSHFWPLPAFVAWLLLIMLIAFNLSRLMSIAGTGFTRQRRIMLVAFLLTLFLSVRTLLYEPRSLFDLTWIDAIVGRFASPSASLWRKELALFLVIAVLWWRGLGLSHRHVAVDEIGFRMRLGGLLLAPLIVVLSYLPLARNATPFVMLFFLAALMAVALTRAEEVARQHTGATYPMSPQWVATIFTTSLFIVTAAALAGSALSGRGFRQLIQWLSPLWDALLLGGMVVVTTVTYLLLGLLTPLQWLLRYLLELLGGLGIEGLPEPETLTPELTDANVDQLLLDLNNSNSALFLWLNRLAIGVFVVVLLLVVYFALRRYFYHREMSFGMAQVGRSSAQTAPGDRRLRRGLLDRLGLFRRWRAAATVRQLYQLMCAEAAGHGFPRTPSETPFEYLKTLAELWPSGSDEYHLITNAYVRVRYGEVPESAEELEDIHIAWQRLAQMLAPH